MLRRLLFHRVRPVFVFDGSTPALKRRTTAARRKCALALFCCDPLRPGPCQLSEPFPSAGGATSRPCSTASWRSRYWPSSSRRTRCSRSPPPRPLVLRGLPGPARQQTAAVPAGAARRSGRSGRWRRRGATRARAWPGAWQPVLSCWESWSAGMIVTFQLACRPSLARMRSTSSARPSRTQTAAPRCG